MWCFWSACGAFVLILILLVGFIVFSVTVGQVDYSDDIITFSMESKLFLLWFGGVYILCCLQCLWSFSIFRCYRSSHVVRFVRLTSLMSAGGLSVFCLLQLEMIWKRDTTHTTTNFNGKRFNANFVNMIYIIFVQVIFIDSAADIMEYILINTASCILGHSIFVLQLGNLQNVQATCF